MTQFRTALALTFAGIAFYTVLAISNDGADLVSVFLGDILAMGWRGQFNLDFMSYLLLSALWIAWRNGFSAGGIGLGAVASVLGVLFFAPYLLIATARAGGDMRRVLLGVHADPA